MDADAIQDPDSHYKQNRIRMAEILKTGTFKFHSLLLLRVGQEGDERHRYGRKEDPSGLFHHEAGPHSHTRHVHGQVSNKFKGGGSELDNDNKVGVKNKKTACFV